MLTLKNFIYLFFLYRSAYFDASNALQKNVGTGAMKDWKSCVLKKNLVGTSHN